MPSRITPEAVSHRMRACDLRAGERCRGSAKQKAHLYSKINESKAKNKLPIVLNISSSTCLPVLFKLGSS